MFNFKHLKFQIHTRILLKDFLDVNLHYAWIYVIHLNTCKMKLCLQTPHIDHVTNMSVDVSVFVTCAQISHTDINNE